MRKLLFVVLVVALALGLVGCQSVSEKIGEEVGEEIAGGIVGGDIEVDGDEVTIKTEEGEATIGSTEGELPEDFPKDFPEYKGIEVESASSIAAGEEVTYYVNLYSDDAVKDIYEWYKSEFTGDGWTIDGDYMFSDASTGDSGMLTVNKGETMTATVSFGESDGRTAVGVILMVK